MAVPLGSVSKSGANLRHHRNHGVLRRPEVADDSQGQIDGAPSRETHGDGECPHGVCDPVEAR